jgi:hypothetical protein
MSRLRVAMDRVLSSAKACQLVSISGFRRNFFTDVWSSRSINDLRSGSYSFRFVRFISLFDPKHDNSWWIGGTVSS